MRFKVALLCLLHFCLGYAACSGSGGGGTSNLCTGISSVGGCLNVAVNQGSSALSLTKQSGKENYLFVLSATDNDGQTAATTLIPYTIEISSATGSLKTIKGALGSQPKANPRQRLLERRVAAENKLRNYGRRLLAEALKKGERRQLFARQPLFAVGDQRAFNILTDVAAGTCTNSVQFRSQYRGNNVELWLDTADLALAAGVNFNNIGDQIDQIIVPRARTFFGVETDLDSNNRINVVFTSKLNIQTQGGNSPLYIGFFNAADMVQGAACNNYGETFYAVIPEVTTGAQTVAVDTDEVLATAAHEMQHLISFASHVVTGGGQPEALWLDEGLSHLAEDIAGYGLYNFAFVASYLSNANTIGIAADSDLSSAAQRGGAMLLLLYLFQQQGGASYSTTSAGEISGLGVDFLRSILANDTSQKLGIGALEQVQSGRLFKDMLAAVGLTLAYDARSLSNDSLVNLDNEVTDSFTGQKRNFRLRGSTRSFPGQGSALLSGPAALNWASGFSQDLRLSGFNFVEFANSQSGTVSINFSGEASADHFFFIVRLGDQP